MRIPEPASAGRSHPNRYIGPYPFHVYLLLAIAVGSAILSSSGEWGVGFGIGVALTIALTAHRNRRDLGCP